MSHRDLKNEVKVTKTKVTKLLTCSNNMYMHFWQGSVDNFIRNHAYMNVSQILSHSVIVQNNICLLLLVAGVNYCRPKQYLSLTFGGGCKLLL